jgi:uncharacterized cupin superfamily protein
MTRPPFVIRAADVPETEHQYPGSAEKMAPSRAIGLTAGLQRIGVHLVRVAPGTRTSYPHAEEDEEEFVYVVDGELDAWIDGELVRVRAGDFIAFPAGTGICHTFINDGDRDALLLSGGERGKSDSRIFYPGNPERRKDLPWSSWWDDVPARPQGGHPGTPGRREKG